MIFESTRKEPTQARKYFMIVNLPLFAFKKAETCIPLSCVLIFHSFMKSETCIGDSSRRNDHGPK